MCSMTDLAEEAFRAKSLKVPQKFFVLTESCRALVAARRLKNDTLYTGW